MWNGASPVWRMAHGAAVRLAPIEHLNLGWATRLDLTREWVWLGPSGRRAAEEPQPGP